MYEWFKFLHLAAAIVWMGGMALVILALRPVVIAQMAPPERLALMAAVLNRFFCLGLGLDCLDFGQRFLDAVDG